MNSKNSLAKNVFFQTFYNVLVVITPFITVPIISRELGAENLGLFSYTLTISHYFTVFALLGIVNFGTRAIAETCKDICEISKTFWNIYFFQFSVAFLCNLLYLLYIFLFQEALVNIFIFQLFWVLAALIDINWLFFGLEEFRVTVIRSVFIKFLTVILIILFVDKYNKPLETYIFIMAGGQFLSNIVLLPLLREKIVWSQPDFSIIKKNIKPILILFIPILASMLYGSIDKVMLGNMSQFDELGYYYNADRIIFIPMGIINGISTVMFPRISSLLSNNKKDEGLRFISTSYEVTIWLGILFSFGIAGCINEFVPLFLGNGFEKCVILVYIMVPIFVVSVVCNFYRLQYLIPLHYDKLYAIALVVGTIVNIILNFFLIPDYKAVGAALSTLCAHFVVMFIQFRVNEGIKLKTWFYQLCFYAILGFLMFIVMRSVSQVSRNNIVNVLVECILGGCTYVIVSVVFWKITNQLNEKRALIKL